MLLAVSTLLAAGGVAGGAVGLTAGFAATGAAGFATTGAAGLAGVLGASLSAGCLAVSEVALSAAGMAFITPVAADFAIAASAAGVSDGGSQLKSSRPSVGPTDAFDAGAELAAFGAGFDAAGVSGSHVNSMTSESAAAGFLAAGSDCLAGAAGAACFAVTAGAAGLD